MVYWVRGVFTVSKNAERNMAPGLALLMTVLVNLRNFSHIISQHILEQVYASIICRRVKIQSAFTVSTR